MFSTFLQKLFNLISKFNILKYILKRGNTFDIYFGIPGSGKTTFAAYLTKKLVKRGKTIHSNLPIKGAYAIEPTEDIGVNLIEKTLLIIDEAGIEYNNRDFKEFSKNSLKFYKYHRHFKVDVAIFSQDFADMDLKLRKLATALYLVKRSIIPFFVVRRRIIKKIGIDDLTHQVIEKYNFVPFSRKWILCYPLWQMFNTHDTYKLPKKEFKKW